MKSQFSKSQIARKLHSLEGKYRIRTEKGWGCWIWEYKQCGDHFSKWAWHSVCPIEQAQEFFGWQNEATTSIELINEFHNARTTIRVPGNIYPGQTVEISGYQYRRAWKVLCGRQGCTCGTTRGGNARLIADGNHYFAMQMDRKTASIKTATWNGNSYLCGGWSSADGDEWFTEDGRPVTGPQFDRATIRLSGGPRNGDTVA